MPSGSRALVAATLLALAGGVANVHAAQPAASTDRAPVAHRQGDGPVVRVTRGAPRPAPAAVIDARRIRDTQVRRAGESGVRVANAPAPRTSARRVVIVSASSAVAQRIAQGEDIRAIFPAPAAQEHAAQQEQTAVTTQPPARADAPHALAGARAQRSLEASRAAAEAAQKTPPLTVRTARADVKPGGMSASTPASTRVAGLASTTGPERAAKAASDQAAGSVPSKPQVRVHGVSVAQARPALSTTAKPSTTALAKPALKPGVSASAKPVAGAKAQPIARPVAQAQAHSKAGAKPTVAPAPGPAVKPATALRPTTASRPAQVAHASPARMSPQVQRQASAPTSFQVVSAQRAPVQAAQPTRCSTQIRAQQPTIRTSLDIRRDQQVKGRSKVVQRATLASALPGPARVLGR